MRDQKTQALINTDADALYKYKIEREKTRKLVSMEYEIKSLKEKVDFLFKILEDRIEKNNV